MDPSSERQLPAWNARLRLSAQKPGAAALTKDPPYRSPLGPPQRVPIGNGAKPQAAAGSAATSQSRPPATKPAKRHSLATPACLLTQFEALTMDQTPAAPGPARPHARPPAAAATKKPAWGTPLQSPCRPARVSFGTASMYSYTPEQKQRQRRPAEAAAQPDATKQPPAAAVVEDDGLDATSDQLGTPLRSTAGHTPRHSRGLGLTSTPVTFPDLSAAADATTPSLTPAAAGVASGGDTPELAAAAAAGGDGCGLTMQQQQQQDSSPVTAGGQGPAGGVGCTTPPTAAAEAAAAAEAGCCSPVRTPAPPIALLTPTGAVGSAFKSHSKLRPAERVPVNDTQRRSREVASLLQAAAPAAAAATTSVATTAAAAAGGASSVAGGPGAAAGLAVGLGGGAGGTSGGMELLGRCELLSPVRPRRAEQEHLGAAGQVLTPVRRSARKNAVGAVAGGATPAAAVGPMLEATNFCYQPNPGMVKQEVEAASTKKLQLPTPKKLQPPSAKKLPAWV